MADPNNPLSNPIIPSGSNLSPLEQAAIVLLSMGEEPAAGVLRCLSREELLEVTQVMSRMSGIKVESVRTSIQRFFDEYREQSGVHGASRSYLKRSLDLALGGEIASSVLNNIYGDAIRPLMERLQWASPKWLADFIADEHVRMQAVFLAFLPPALAGSVIDALPLSGNKQQMVELLRARDPDVVSEIEMSMYDFFILSRQPETVLQRLLEEIAPEQWAIALKGAEPELRDAIMQTMPRRQAQGFEDMMRRAGPVPRSRIEQTRREIMAEVKALVDAGEIEVQLFAEAVVE
jgi:flagellar motor switch protein FliG